MGIGGHTFDVVSILKSRQQVIDCRAELEAERAVDTPSVFTKIHITFIVTGYNLKEAQVSKAVNLSAEKYCSASIMMKAAEVK